MRSQILSISDIIALQSTEGFWKDIHLIAKLYNQELMSSIEKEPQVILLITYLVCKWIEKNYPAKQYSLVVKKGLNFVTKNGEDLSNL